MSDPPERNASFDKYPMPSKTNNTQRKKHRIIYLTHGARNIGGGEYALYALLSNINRNLFEPVVFYGTENEIIKKMRSDGVELVQVKLHEKITSVFRDEIKNDFATYLSYAYHVVVSIICIARLLRKYRADILHPHDNLSKIIGGLAAKIAGIKVVVHCHDLLGDRRIERILLHYQRIFMNRIIAVSEGVRRTFILNGKALRKVVTIYNGIDLGKYSGAKDTELKGRLGISNDKVVVGIVAMFDVCKGHLYLFGALEHLPVKERDRFVCLVIGDGRERPNLEKIVKEKGLEQQVKFLGYRTDVPKLLGAIDILIIPSVQESFGIVALEAMAMKVPVIVTRVGGLPEIVEEGVTGLIVPPADVDALSRAILGMLYDRKRREKMGEAGRARVAEKFDIKISVRMTEQVYESLLVC